MGEGVAWTKGTTLGFTRWSQERFELAPVELKSLDLPGTTGLVLRYRDVALLVAHARPAVSDDGTKRAIEFVGRTLDDVRKATKYFTAATTSSVRFYVGSEAERDQWLQLVLVNTHPLQSPPTPTHPPPTLPVLPELPPPVVAPPPPPPSTPRRLHEIIDEGFQSLTLAAASEDAGNIPEALAAYERARSLFAGVYPQLPPNKTQQLLQTKCKEIQAIINDLATPLDQPTLTATSTNVAMPPSIQLSPASTAHNVVAPPMTHASPTPAVLDTAPQSASSDVPPAPALTMDERLYKLQGFADTLQLEKARAEKSIEKSDLELRFAALKSEATRAPPMESLEARLNRLRGVPSTVTSNNLPSAENAMELAFGQALDDETRDVVREAMQTPDDRRVDELLAMVQHEIALGIMDDSAGVGSSSELGDSSDSDDELQLKRKR
ncbi:hypothetical protein ACHHYP_06891 [Achlya hypogyna]|uniref:PH domain-containing protein n=1 Tax=Achlya hypogyna TaxID=1202772 RepID=A0A1V9YRP8_ACHHY|nr:hypothetical protein ACHHYP_06891 [Achlya hypogyna]